MNLNAPELMEPIFRFLDGIIDDYGLYIFMGMVYAAPLLIAWILSGGLRRKSKSGFTPRTPPIIVIHLPGNPPQEPEAFNPFPAPQEPSWHDYDDCHWD